MIKTNSINTPKYKVEINYKEFIYFFKNRGIVIINKHVKNIHL
jgi:hypothetical protein